MSSGLNIQDAKRFAPATLRNRDAIVDVLRTVLPASGTVLEIASGSGEHAVFFAQSLPNLTWQPTDQSAECCASIAAWSEEARLSHHGNNQQMHGGVANLLPPRLLDVSAPLPSVHSSAPSSAPLPSVRLSAPSSAPLPSIRSSAPSSAPWAIGAVDAIICINMIHISPWQATLGLLRNAALVLPASGPLYLYGPFRRHGVPTSPSNEDFDASLKERDPQWGLRQLEDVEQAALAAGLQLKQVLEMPANNLSVVFRK